MNAPVDYVPHGLALVRIPFGRKGPIGTGWNLRENAITTPDKAALLTGSNIGLAHAYCHPHPTAALDIDDMDEARLWLDERGIDLDDLLDADDAVQVVSGKAGRAKLLYRLAAGTAPMESIVIKAGTAERVTLEFRCAAKSGLTVQDVLPPSIHPETGRRYQWGGKGDWRELPTIPAKLLAVWKAAIDEKVLPFMSRASPFPISTSAREMAAPSARRASRLVISKSVDDTPRQRANVAEMLAQISADCSYDLYLVVVWAILSLGWDDVEELARQWCMTAPERFNDASFATVVASYDATRSPTIGTLYYHAKNGGRDG